MNVPLPVLGSWFTILESQVTVPNGSYVQLVKQNPQRYCVVFSAIDGKQVNLALDPNFDIRGSFTLANQANASVQNGTFDFATYGGLVQVPWFGTSGTAVAQAIGIIEVLYMPPASEQ